MHNFFRPGRNGNSAGSEVTHRPMAAEINRCRLMAQVAEIPWVWETSTPLSINTLRPRQNGCHFPDCIFFNENIWISIKISLKFVAEGLINNIPALVQIMAWHWLCDKPLYGPMMFSFLIWSRSLWIHIITILVLISDYSRILVLLSWN